MVNCKRDGEELEISSFLIKESRRTSPFFSSEQGNSMKPGQEKLSWDVRKRSFTQDGWVLERLSPGKWSQHQA